MHRGIARGWQTTVKGLKRRYVFVETEASLVKVSSSMSEAEPSTLRLGQCP